MKEQLVIHKNITYIKKNLYTIIHLVSRCNSQLTTHCIFEAFVLLPNGGSRSIEGNLPLKLPTPSTNDYSSGLGEVEDLFFGNIKVAKKSGKAIYLYIII